MNRYPFLHILFGFLMLVSAEGFCDRSVDGLLRATFADSVPDVKEERKVYTEVEIEPVLLDFNTISLSTDDVDQELFYWTQQDVSLRKQVRFLTSGEAQKKKIVPDIFVRVLILSFAVKASNRPTSQSGLSTDSRELVASGKIRLTIQSATDKKVLLRRSLFGVYRKNTNYQLRVDSSVDNVHDPATQSIFNAWFSENMDLITDELNNYFSISVAQ